ncbi:ADP-ribosyltransferase [Nocardia terpenica]|uniref:ADP ribosyltransferase domain-containing protein n=1 Tax=Nocardia terpenica TaxID=455432 RepID=A0A164PTM9_9NOCA|nr:ADP-ribosyltransferase [Nocardia terpenica]KZM76051.1 hypothetical protein AWN90_17295 [Nocardia terpenica]NQE85603.1 hypothetical protein [Nocardia terpenica]
MNLRSSTATAILAAGILIAGSETCNAAPPQPPAEQADKSDSAPLDEGADGDNLDEALNTLNLEMGAGQAAALPGAVIGAAIGCAAGAATGSAVADATSSGVMTPEDDTVGCLALGATGAAIGDAVAGGAVATAAIGHFLTTILNRHPTAGPAPEHPEPHSNHHGGSAEQHGNGHSEAHRTGRLTQDEAAAVRSYTGSGSEDLNNALRAGRGTREQHERIKKLIGALKKLPVHRGEVFRGADLPADVLKQYKPGNTITEKAFTSTSATEAGVNSGTVRFHIMSETGRDVSKHSGFPWEQEVVFLPGTRFRVTGTHKQYIPRTDGSNIEINHIEMTEVR